MSSFCPLSCPKATNLTAWSNLWNHVEPVRSHPASWGSWHVLAACCQMLPWMQRAQGRWTPLETWQALDMKGMGVA